jgi:transcriptional regulator with XRE-family HTH domain
MRCREWIRNGEFCFGARRSYDEVANKEAAVHQKSPSPIDRHVGARIRMRRMMLGMSQEKLGEALGLTFQQVQKYEKGTNRIGATRLLQIAGILGVRVEYLYEGLPELRAAGPQAEGPILEFLTSPESDRLVRNFVRLKDEVARRKVADLVEWLASTADGGQGRRET